MCGKVKHTNHLRTLFCSPKCKTRHRRKEGYLKQNIVPKQEAVTENAEWDTMAYAKRALASKEAQERLQAIQQWEIENGKKAPDEWYKKE